MLVPEVALGISEPTPQLGAPRIAFAAIARRVPRREGRAEPARDPRGIARGHRDQRGAHDRVEVAGVLRHQLRRERARAGDLTAGDERLGGLLGQLLRALRHADRREVHTRLGALAGGAALAQQGEQLVEHGCASGIRDVRPASLRARRITEHIGRHVTERVVEAQPILGIRRRAGLVLEALGGAHEIAALDRDLRERVPRRTAARIDPDRRLVMRQCVRRPQRTSLGLRGVDEADRDRRRMARDIWMLGERAEVQRGLPPQLASEAALAERERDR